MRYVYKFAVFFVPAFPVSFFYDLMRAARHDVHLGMDTIKM